MFFHETLDDQNLENQSLGKILLFELISLLFQCLILQTNTNN